jgi:hypothetical protein
MRHTALLKRALIFFHRWLGVALSAVFLAWFASGIVMMYRGFPGVTEQDRLRRAPTLDPSRIVVSVEDAAAFAGFSGGGPAPPVTLTSFDGRPVYRIDLEAGPSMVYADDGTTPMTVDDGVMDRAAAAWAGRAADEARKESIQEIDQWTLAGRLRTLRPLYKYSWPDGQQVYVDGNTAEVVQYTTNETRFWAYLGAIPHWLYFTPLRKHQAEWFAVVVWASLVGTVSALIGLVIAVWTYSPAKRYRHEGIPTSIPYRGWKRWHAVAGLLFGVVTVTWTFSGLLSMGPFPATDRLADWMVSAEDAKETREAFDIEGALRGTPVGLEAFAARTPAAAIASMPGFEIKALELATFAGVPAYLAWNASGDTRIIPVSGEPRAGFDASEVMRVVRAAAGERLAEMRVLEEYDAYYLDRRRNLPLPVIHVRLNGSEGSRYIDPGTGRVVGSYSGRQWIERWLYHGLHSLDFPWLYRYRPLWDFVVITLLLGGTVLCLTSVVLAGRVLSRKVAALFRRHSDRAAEDLATDPESLT